MLSKFKILFFVLALQLVVVAQFSGGSGSEGDPWLIRTPENLDSIRYYLGPANADKYFKQITDIDLGVTPWNVGEGWEPIGTITDSLFFYGKYNGDGHKISNMIINEPDSTYMGLFGKTKDAILDRISLIDVNIVGKLHVGALVGQFDTGSGIITNSFSTGTVLGEGAVGGLVGSFYDSYTSTRMINCYSRCDITGIGEYKGVYIHGIGGIVGTSGLFSFIENSYSTGKVTGTSYNYINGFDGTAIYNFSGNNYWDIEFSECLNSFSAEGRTTEEMTLHSPNTYVNWDFDSTWVEDIYNINDGYPILQSQLALDIPEAPQIISTEINGMNLEFTWNNPNFQRNGEALTELDHIYITRDNELIYTNSSPVIGGQESFIDTVLLASNYSYKIYGDNSNGLGLYISSVKNIGNIFAGGTGTELDPYLISNPNELNNIRYVEKDPDNLMFFEQTADIDLNILPWNEGKGWEPIDDFMDLYDGNGFKISNMMINRPNNDELGLFSDIIAGIIENVIIENANITGHDRLGSLAGVFDHAKPETKINNVHTSCTITGNDDIGGLLGYSYPPVSNCSVISNISGNENLGGVIGRCDGSISKSNSSCNIDGNRNLGGLVGYAEALSHITIEQCYTEGTITGNINSSNIGGIIADFDGADITNCYSRCNVTGNNEIAGFTPTFTWITTSITNCYSTGAVTSNWDAGGFTSNSDTLSVINCYWDIETSGQITSEGGEGRTTDEMTNPNFRDTYIDWDFENIWTIDPLINDGYPILKWQDTGIETYETTLPNTITLEQNYPNPFNPSTMISYNIPNGYNENVKLQIFNTKGELVNTLVNKKQNSGKYLVEFNATHLNSGMYFYTLKTLNSVTTKKMILLK